MPKPLDPFEKMNPAGEFFFMIFCAIVDVICSAFYVVLFMVAAAGSIINSFGYTISAIGQFLMKADPLR